MTRAAQADGGGRLHAVLTAVRAHPLHHGVMLALFALTSAALLAASYELTREAIEQRASENLDRALAGVLPDGMHDNDPAQSVVEIVDPLEGPVAVHRAELAGQGTGAAFSLTGAGYGGDMVVLLGVSAEGRVLGARVLSHSETPGLGDKIEAAKSDWITSFDGLALGDPPAEQWRVRKDGGRFDQFAGATITPRAVVAIVQRGLELTTRHRDALFAAAAPAMESSE